MTQRKWLLQFIYPSLILVSMLAGLFFLNPSQAGAEEPAPINTDTVVDSMPYQIPVGIFVTSIYGIDFRSEQFTVTFWLWSTFPTETMKEIAGDDYIPFNTIEIVNAQNKSISPTDQYIIPDPDNGTTYAIAKFTTTIIQHWDVSDFPFDRQDLTLVIESVGIQSDVINFVPDIQNSLISEEMKINGWTIDDLQLEAINYEYRSTFGDPSGHIGVYPRIIAHIPVKRIGYRLFINSFLGFFIAFIIISLMYLLDVDSRVGLVMTAIFAAVGNKYTIDTYFPTQSSFSLSDLVQICSFTVIAIGIITTIISMRLTKADKQDKAKKVDRLVFFTMVPAYIIVIGIGTLFAIQG